MKMTRTTNNSDEYSKYSENGMTRFAPTESSGAYYKGSILDIVKHFVD